jgi:hypothetical protein
MQKKSLAEREERSSRHITDLMKKMPDYVQEYMLYQEERHVSVVAQEISARCLQMFFEALAAEKGKALNEVSIEDMENVPETVWQMYLCRERGHILSAENPGLEPSERMKKERWKEIRKFYQYLYRYNKTNYVLQKDISR